MSRFTRDELIDRAFLRVAQVMHGMWEEKGSSDTRLLQEPLIPDTYVVVGESLAGTDHREHVVPRAVICDHCHTMFAAGVDLDTVAKHIRRTLKIVRIARDEQIRLDRNDQFGLKQKMPDGWSFETGDVFARLKVAQITFKIV